MTSGSTQAQRLRRGTFVGRGGLCRLVNILATALNISGGPTLQRRGFATGRVEQERSDPAQQAAAAMRAKPDEECRSIGRRWRSADCRGGAAGQLRRIAAGPHSFCVAGL